jgi:protein-S-isoprenylcysteine O-methyltransferase Ste14
MNILKTLLYMGIMHGFFTYYFPYQLALATTELFEPGIFRYLAIPFWLSGTLIIIWCSIDIIRKGRGTPAHLDPPKELVITGLYRYVRNPIYMGAMLVLFGYMIWSVSAWVILYSALAYTAFSFLIIVIEEPILKNTFGIAYTEYAERVPRWIPKFK